MFRVGGWGGGGRATPRDLTYELNFLIKSPISQFHSCVYIFSFKLNAPSPEVQLYILVKCPSFPWAQFSCQFPLELKGLKNCVYFITTKSTCLYLMTLQSI